MKNVVVFILMLGLWGSYLSCNKLQYTTYEYKLDPIEMPIEFQVTDQSSSTNPIFPLISTEIQSFNFDFNYILRNKHSLLDYQVDSVVLKKVDLVLDTSSSLDISFIDSLDITLTNLELLNNAKQVVAYQHGRISNNVKNGSLTTKNPSSKYFFTDIYNINVRGSSATYFSSIEKGKFLFYFVAYARPFAKL